MLFETSQPHPQPQIRFGAGIEQQNVKIKKKAPKPPGATKLEIADKATTGALVRRDNHETLLNENLC